MYQLSRVMQELTQVDPPPAVKEVKEVRALKAEDPPKQAPAKTDVTPAVANPEGRNNVLMGFSSEAARERQRKVEAYKKLHKIDEIGREGSLGNAPGRGQSRPHNRHSSSTVTTLQPP